MECFLYMGKFSALYLYSFMESSKLLRESGTVDPHYLQILYVQICLLVKTYLYNAQISSCSTVRPFVDTHSGGKFELLTCMFPAQVGDALPSCFRSPTITRCPLRGLISATLRIFELFLKKIN